MFDQPSHLSRGRPRGLAEVVVVSFDVGLARRTASAASSWLLDVLAVAVYRSFGMNDLPIMVLGIQDLPFRSRLNHQSGAAATNASIRARVFSRSLRD